MCYLVFVWQSYFKAFEVQNESKKNLSIKRFVVGYLKRNANITLPLQAETNKKAGLSLHITTIVLTFIYEYAN